MFQSEKGAKLGEFFFSAGLSKQLLSRLARPTATSVILEEIEGFIGLKSKQFLISQTWVDATFDIFGMIQWTWRRNFSGTLSKIHHNIDSSRSPLTLDMLPSDIIFVVFTMLSDIEDVVMFALTCSTFWITGKKRLSAVRDEYTMLWSGCRIGCIGDYVYDTPPGMLTDADFAELKAYAATTGANNPQAKLFAFLNETFLMAPFSRPSSERWRFCFHDIECRVLSALCDRPLLLSPVLRNLTKREYIREDRDTLVKLGRANVFGQVLGQVLLARICWSSNPSTSMAYDGNLHRGEWAGDRVDCVEFQDFEKEDLSAKSDDHDGEQRPWKDITKEAWGLLLDIYNAQMRFWGYVWF
jgi:hypothetical protein